MTPRIWIALRAPATHRGSALSLGPGAPTNRLDSRHLPPATRRAGATRGVRAARRTQESVAIGSIGSVSLVHVGHVVHEGTAAPSRTRPRPSPSRAAARGARRARPPRESTTGPSPSSRVGAPRRPRAGSARGSDRTRSAEPFEVSSTKRVGCSTSIEARACASFEYPTSPISSNRAALRVVRRVEMPVEFARRAVVVPDEEFHAEIAADLRRTEHHSVADAPGRRHESSHGEHDSHSSDPVAHDPDIAARRAREVHGQEGDQREGSWIHERGEPESRTAATSGPPGRGPCSSRSRVAT